MLRSMKILFADYVPPEEHAAKEMIGHKRVIAVNNPNSKRRWWDVLIEQCINSGIVASVAFFSTMAATSEADWEVAGIAFGMTFFFELRKMRHL